MKATEGDGISSEQHWVKIQVLNPAQKYRIWQGKLRS